MKPYYTDDSVTLYHGDALDVLRELPDESVHAVVTDPPYGLANTTPEQVADTLVRWVNGDRDYLPGGAGFMGKAWDAFVPPVAVWDECLRVLKPGGHVLAFAGSRTHDLMTLGLRLAGFDIRDSIAWLYASGFPKSLDVSKAIDKAAGAPQVREPITPEAARWQGWGTALKPAFEPVVVARKPLAGTVAANVLEHGTGALNIDGCRIEYQSEADAAQAAVPQPVFGTKAEGAGTYNYRTGEGRNGVTHDVSKGRWPANVVLDDTQAAELDRQSGVSSSRRAPMSMPKGHAFAGATYGRDSSERGAVTERGYDDEGGASRFFPTFRYEPKAPTSERPRDGEVAHPTVKPLDLMRWLVRLVTPPGGTVLEPFAGSGTTAEACVLEGFQCVAVEREADYLPLITARLTKPLQVGLDLGGIA